MSTIAPKQARQVTAVRLALTSPVAADMFTQKGLETATGHTVDRLLPALVKELVDNSLDACEEAGTDPEIVIEFDETGLRVTDNGPGIPPSTVELMADLNHRVSSRKNYAAPDRGAQGNAAKTLFAARTAITGGDGRVEIVACGIRHDIRVGLDALTQVPELVHDQVEVGETAGTSVFLDWPHRQSTDDLNNSEGDDQPGRPDLACLFWADAESQVVEVAENFAVVNRHPKITVVGYGETLLEREPTDTGWKKWRPNLPSSAHWYGPQLFKQLVAASIANDRERGVVTPTRTFVSQFDGMARSDKNGAVLRTLDLTREPLSALINDAGELDVDSVERMRLALMEATAAVKPYRLGIIGADHFEQLFVDLDGIADSFQYRKALGTAKDGRPYVLEVAFARLEDDDADRRLITAVNWSPSVAGDVFRKLPGGASLDSLLSNLEAGDWEPVIFAAHVAMPAVAYTDRGKGGVILPFEVQKDLATITAHVLKGWTKQRRREERSARAFLSRDRATRRGQRKSVKQASYDALPAAYDKASGGKSYSPPARMILYAGRPAILEASGADAIDHNYFAQRILQDFIEDHPAATSDWDPVYDARGNFFEPHTGKSVPLGTLAVRHYLEESNDG